MLPMQSMSMKRANWRARIGAILLAGGCVMLSACGLLSDQPDETAGWSANKLYSEAKDALDSGDFTRAVKLYDKLEGRYPFGRFAQQAQKIGRAHV